MYPQYSTMKRSSDPMISNLIDELKFSESPSLRLAFEDNRGSSLITLYPSWSVSKLTWRTTSVCEKLKADEHEDGDQATNTPGQDYDEPAVTRRELYSYYLCWFLSSLFSLEMISDQRSWWYLTMLLRLDRVKWLGSNPTKRLQRY